MVTFDSMVRVGEAGDSSPASTGEAGTGGSCRPSAPDSTWELPHPKGVYLRSSLVDLMPGPLSPLFITLALPAIAGRGLQKVMGELTGSRVRLPENYITTVNSYAYVCGAMKPAEWWWVLTRRLPAAPRILRQGARYWREQAQPKYAHTIRRLEIHTLEIHGLDNACLPPLTAGELARRIKRVVEASGEYVGALLATQIGVSDGWEGLFTRLYEKLVRREGDPPPAAFLTGFNSLPVQAEKSLYDLAQWAGKQPELKAYLCGTPAAALINAMDGGPDPRGLSEYTWADWRRRFRAHLARFGYHLQDLDFARPLPLEDPTPMLEACKTYLRGEGDNPYERQARLEAQRRKIEAQTLARLHGVKRWLFQKTLGWAQGLAEVRESATAEIGLGYPLMRRMLAELGQRIHAAGAIQQASDIYLLHASELCECVVRLDAGLPLPELVQRVEQRRAQQNAALALAPPPVLPPRHRLKPAAEKDQTH